ncbi:MAG: CDP-diacylglycerol--glycerol-3-phosphate 3-phosphatidyltransferase, partial [Actinomycetota bacterium]|nr:CDP-diacylglycerol--glycerol-3-phosphate 3-phosphatidyltransferase [Actinomycetota bacterium]
MSDIDPGRPAEDTSGASQPQRPAPSAWNLPNLLTVSRILLVPVFGWLLLVDDGQSTPYRLGALAVFIVAMITDSVDGDLARRRGLVTDFGTVTDPIADKALMGMALVGLSVIGDVPWWITVVILVREVGITAMRFVVIRHGVMAASRGGKLKTVLQTTALSMLLFPLAALPVAGLWQLIAQVVLL